MDVAHNLLLIVVAILLVLLNAFFVAAEFAIVKLRATRVEALQREHGLLGRALSVVHGHLDAYLSACQLGITLASLGLGWIGEPAFATLIAGPLHVLGVASEPQIETIAVVTAFAFISFLHIVLGELAPKSLALRRPEGLSLATSIPLLVFYWLMYPAIWVLNASANRFLRGVGLGEPSEEKPYTDEELRTILHFSRAAQQEEGEPSEMTLLMTHTLELAELEAGDVMRSRREMVTLSSELPLSALRQAINTAGYSRYPLVDAATDDIVGIVHVKDVLMEEAGDDLGVRLRHLARPPVHVKTSAPALELLRRFRQGTSHFALVHDEEGGLAGFLTLEDLLETVFGEIVDEHEKSRGKTIRRGPVKLKDGSLMVRGSTPLFLVERAIGQVVDDAGDASTIGGLVMAKLGHVPAVGDMAEFEAFAVTVRRMDGPRIVAAKLTPRPGVET